MFQEGTWCSTWNMELETWNYKMGEAGQIMRVNPAVAIPGGEVVIECESFDTSHARTCAAWFENSLGHLVGVSRRRVLAIVPEESRGEVDLTLESNSQRTAPAKLAVGALIAEDMHMVANPAFDP